MLITASRMWLPINYVVEVIDLQPFSTGRKIDAMRTHPRSVFKWTRSLTTFIAQRDCVRRLRAIRVRVIGESTLSKLLARFPR